MFETHGIQHLERIVAEIGTTLLELDRLSPCLLMIQSLYIVVDCPFQLAKLLNADLQTISDWAAAWLVTFNLLKTLSMKISRKRNPVFHHPHEWYNDQEHFFP